MQQAGLVLPRSFQVHKKQTPPLVTESNLHDHLIVLAAFHRLSQFVKSSEAPFEIRGVLPVSPPVKWYLFLYRARHRFQLWVEKVVAKPARTDGFVARLADDECPPLDVLMFFHCFLLSPRYVICILPGDLIV